MILVTGASGVLGSALVRRLAAEGVAVRALLLSGAAAPRLRGLAGVERVVGDLTVPESLPPAARGVKAVFHAAGIVPFANGLRREMMAVNAEGAGRLLEAAAAAGVTDFLYVSSASTRTAAAGPVPPATPMWTASAPPRPTSRNSPAGCEP